MRCRAFVLTHSRYKRFRNFFRRVVLVYESTLLYSGIIPTIRGYFPLLDSGAPITSCSFCERRRVGFPYTFRFDHLFKELQPSRALCAISSRSGNVTLPAYDKAKRKHIKFANSRKTCAICLRGGAECYLFDILQKHLGYCALHLKFQLMASEKDFFYDFISKKMYFKYLVR